MNWKGESDGKNGICLPCEVYAGGPEPSACSRGVDYLSREEEEILGSLRELKEKARFLRGQIKGIEFAGEMGHVVDGARGELSTELEAAMAEMKELRKAWKELEARLRKANARKLALLGHGPWEDAGAGNP